MKKKCHGQTPCATHIWPYSPGKNSMMVRKFAELRTNMTPEAQARLAAMAEGMLVEMQFRDLRKSRHFTQVEVA